MNSVYFNNNFSHFSTYCFPPLWSIMSIKQCHHWSTAFYLSCFPLTATKCLRFIIHPNFGWDILMKEYYWHLSREVCSKTLKDTSTYLTHRSQVHADIPYHTTYWVYAHTKLLVTLRLRRLCHNRAIQYGNSPHILLLYLRIKYILNRHSCWFPINFYTCSSRWWMAVSVVFNFAKVVTEVWTPMLVLWWLEFFSKISNKLIIYRPSAMAPKSG